MTIAAPRRCDARPVATDASAHAASLLTALADIHARAFAPARGWTSSEIAGFAENGRLVVAGGDQPSGFALVALAGPEAELLTLAVDPNRRREGVGAALLAEALHAARSAGATEIFLEVAADNPAARALYAAFAFRETGRRPGYYARPAGRVDACLMALDLGAGQA